MLKEEVAKTNYSSRPGKTNSTSHSNSSALTSLPTLRSIVSTYNFVTSSVPRPSTHSAICNMASDMSAVEMIQEFEVFSNAIEQLQSEIVRRQFLSSLILPVFSNIFIACRSKSEIKADQFYSNFYDKVKSVSDSCPISDKMLLMNKGGTGNGLQSKDDLEILNNCKIQRTVSAQVLEALTELLSQKPLPFISHLFLNRFQVAVSAEEKEQFTSQEQKPTIAETDEAKNDYASDDVCTCDSRHLFPNVLFHVLNCAYADIYCADISGNYIASGMSDNAIRSIDMYHSQLQKLGPRIDRRASTDCPDDSGSKCDLSEDTQHALNEIFENEPKVESLPSSVLLHGHHKPVHCVKFASTWPYLLSCGEDSDCRLWDVRESRCVSKYSGHNHPLYSVAISKDDFLFASAGTDMTCRLWTFENSREPLRILCRHEATVNSVDFHPNAKFLLSGASDSLAIMWDIDKAQHVRLFADQKTHVSSVKFSPNGLYAAIGTKAGIVCLYDIRSSKQLWQSSQVEKNRQKTRLFEGAVKCLEFSSDSKTLYSAGVSSSLFCWDCEDGRLVDQASEKNCSTVLCLNYMSIDVFNCITLKQM